MLCNRLVSFKFQIKFSNHNLINARYFARQKQAVPSKFTFLSMGKGFSKIFTSLNDKKNLLKVLKYPHPKLRENNEIVEVFDETLENLCKDLLDVMYEDDGIGLAAPQVGINKRIMVFNPLGDRDAKDNEMILINPVITNKSLEKDRKEEGCLSFPMIFGDIDRSIWIDIEYQDIKGKKITCRLTGFPARVFQHEYDHLDKILFIDHFNEQDKEKNSKRLEKYIKKYGPGAAL